MRRFARVLFLVLVFVGLPSRAVWADVKLPAVIGSHMVLQRDQPVPDLGLGRAGGKRHRAVRRHDLRLAKADQTGRWRGSPTEACQPTPNLDRCTIEGSSGSQIELTDILVGEVWFCTGPSNIFWPVQRCDNAKQEMRRADFPRIRFFTVEKRNGRQASGRLWRALVRLQSPHGRRRLGNRLLLQPSDPSGSGRSSRSCSRVSGAALGSKRGPVEIRLEAEPAVKADSWSGGKRSSVASDPAEAQVRHEKQLDARGEKAVAQVKSKGSQPPKRPAAPVDPRASRHRPACLYNGMVAPLVPFSIRGVICYQGTGKSLLGRL